MLKRLRFFCAAFIADRSTAKIEHTPYDSHHCYAAKTVIHKVYGAGTVIKTIRLRAQDYVQVSFYGKTHLVKPYTLKPW